MHSRVPTTQPHERRGGSATTAPHRRVGAVAKLPTSLRFFCDPGASSSGRASLAPGARLLIAEPMAQTPGAHGMGEAYFGMYLWAMGSGRPRSRQTIAQMALAAGFARIRFIATAQPVNASIVVATA